MKNEEFYKRIQIPKKDHYSPVILSISYWWFYIPGNILIILLAPLFKNKSLPALSPHEYLRIWEISAAIVLVLNIIFAWFMDIRPYLNKRKGFYWRGNFIVVGKESSIGFKYITLKPGNNHRIKVSSEFFSSVRERDKIFLERTYLGDIMKISKVSSGLRERITSRLDLMHKTDSRSEL
jgi:hypothetical protein